ncbi:MAG: NUDIX domain-containing protein [Pseudomonas sp.]|nr:NUDIX domain-containing protein [Pseudomonas sp. PIA16]MDE1169148.1 NUDIX domain-containing protein [Pseudomonas sp.]
MKERATVICRMDDKVLFVRKSKSRWSLPGGKIEGNEWPAQAAVRELIEETGLQVDGLNYLAALEAYETLHYVFETPISPEQTARPLNEIADCRWFTLEQVNRRNVNKSIKRLLRDVKTSAA